MNNSALSGKQSVILALFRSGAAERAVDTEDLAMKVAEIDPHHFRWKKYPEQINLERVRLTAKNLLADNPQLIAGGIRNGWMLTPAGIMWCAHVFGDSQSGETLSNAESKRITLRHTEAFQKFHQGNGNDISIYDLRHFLRVDEYSSVRRRKERGQATVNAVMDDEELSSLVAFLQSRFPEEWK
jgi:hypothetical protein